MADPSTLNRILAVPIQKTKTKIYRFNSVCATARRLKMTPNLRNLKILNTNWRKTKINAIESCARQYNVMHKDKELKDLVAIMEHLKIRLETQSFGQKSNKITKHTKNKAQISRFKFAAASHTSHRIEMTDIRWGRRRQYRVVASVA